MSCSHEVEPARHTCDQNLESARERMKPKRVRQRVPGTERQQADRPLGIYLAQD
jgi:hypothetical protein